MRSVCTDRELELEEKFVAHEAFGVIDPAELAADLAMPAPRDVMPLAMLKRERTGGL